nr:unnamed protein product [Callosobruchus analis]CAI5867071.1 unnamed protein product [Callosobruchus analis]
MHSQMIIKY